MSEPTKVFENTMIPGQWHVECSTMMVAARRRSSPAQPRVGKPCGTPCGGVAISEKCSATRLNESQVVVLDVPTRLRTASGSRRLMAHAYSITA
jgi:hypothetical protein